MKKKNPKKNNIRYIALAYLVVVSCLIWGYSIGKFDVFPGEYIDPLVIEVQKFIKGGEQDKEKKLVDRFILHRQVKKEHDRNRKTIDYTIKEFGLNPIDTGGVKRFFVNDHDFKDPGFLVWSRFSATHNQVIVELISLQNFQTVHRWIPPIGKILEQDGLANKNKGTNSFYGYRAQHPFLMEDGRIVFTSGEGAVVCLDKSSNIKWILNGRHAHHSIEMGLDKNLYIPVVIKPDDPENYFGKDMREDGYAVISPEGDLLELHSMGRILMENGHQALLLGQGSVIKDRFHLNDAHPFKLDAGIFRKGDVGLSLRHLSMVMVYRPSTKSIVAMRVGPWLGQHDVNLLPDGRLSILNNEYIRKAGKSVRKVWQKNNSLMIWDPVTDEITEPYREIIEKLKLHTATQGRARILSNGDVYYEKTNQCKLIRLSKDKVRWLFVNYLDENRDKKGAINWARYLNADEVAKFW